MRAAAAAALVRAGVRLADAMDPDAVLAALGEAAVPAIADWCAIHVAQPAGPPALAVVAHADPGRHALGLELHRRWPARGDSAPAQVIASGRPLLHREVPDALLRATAQDPEHLELLRRLGLRSAVVLPLRARGQVLGALTLAFSESGRELDDETLETADALASQAAVVLDNAHLHAEQAEVARTLQRSLLPDELPSIDGFELAVRHRPAGRANEVGGDVYDVVRAADGTWRLLVADIAGKGPGAAALQGVVRHTLAAAALRDPSLRADLTLASDVMLARTQATTFCTAVLVGVTPHPGGGAALCVAAAGHPPPLVLRADGSVEALPARGPVLGIREHPAFELVDAELGRGDLLLLYTDGATELRDVPGDEGEAALRETLAAAVGRPAAEVLERLERDVLVRGGGAPRDDLVLLALRVPG